MAEKAIELTMIFPGMLNTKCPLAGCRAPECASGCVDDQLAEVARMSETDLVEQLALDQAWAPTPLATEDCARLFVDFEIAKSYLALGWGVMMACWKQLCLRVTMLKHWSW